LFKNLKALYNKACGGRLLLLDFLDRGAGFLAWAFILVSKRHLSHAERGKNKSFRLIPFA